ncbi:MAG: phosphatidate cytidylyltransferase [Candidatus Symbiothrix sp.]|jgi:phosphatidate cytidylyltransferase|nr:phosphatidate cytidylyltransferase [Candidatus Symbiothrix sp.]
MKNLLQRTLAGSVYASFIVLGIAWNEYSFLTLFTVATVLCLWEFYGLLEKQKKVRFHRVFDCLGGGILFIACFLYASGTSDYRIFAVYLLYVVIVLIVELYERQPDPITHAAYLFFGQLYIALPFSLLNLIVFVPAASENAVYSWILALALFVFIWINDTGAYIVGSLIGKHRLFERISPQKSWEGFFGGLAFTIASSLIFNCFVLEIPVYHWIGLSVVVVIFGTLGDLIESLMKRTLSVKDSGKAIPGHGGFLDRFDSFLLAVYAVFFYIQFIQN